MNKQISQNETSEILGVNGINLRRALNNNGQFVDNIVENKTQDRFQVTFKDCTDGNLAEILNGEGFDLYVMGARKNKLVALIGKQGT